MLQFNIWQEGTMVSEGFEGIVSNIIAIQPDVVTFSEVRNYNGVPFIPKLIKALRNKGMKYYGYESVSTGIISKYKITSQDVIYPLTNDHGSVIKACIKVNGRHVAVYSAHLDWLHCSYYLPRGYDGCNWEELRKPITNVDSIYHDNRASLRDDAIKAFLTDDDNEIKNGSVVLLGGDFNEPSYLDWQSDTKNIREHKGLVVNWDCSVLLAKKGYKDSFRQIYPNAVKNPGFTFPANNTAVDIKKLCWAPKSDDRERIDFIYYYPHRRLKLSHVSIVGPDGTVVYGKRLEKDNNSEDTFISPTGTWPTDHKALLAVFNVY
jgi:hypothetical protein